MKAELKEARKHLDRSYGCLCRIEEMEIDESQKMFIHFCKHVMSTAIGLLFKLSIHYFPNKE